MLCAAMGKIRGFRLSLQLATALPLALGAFALFADPTSVTFQESPLGSGTPFPSGLHYFNPNQEYTIGATANAGYHFSRWETQGPTVLETSPYESDGIIYVRPGASYFTAVFSKDQNTVTLTMAATEGGGTTTPAVGAHTVPADAPTTITATPAAGYSFLNWQVTGAGAIGDLTTSSTYITCSGNATATAVFKKLDTVTMTIGTSPASAGTTTPAAGSSQVAVGAPIEISVVPTDGYTFSTWQVSGSATIDAPTSMRTIVVLKGAATVTAAMTATPTQVTVTMAVDPAAGGTTNPGIGDITIGVGEPLRVTATPKDGYHFVRWKAQGSINIYDHKASTTFLVVLSSAPDTKTLTAIFAGSSSLVSLRLMASPAAGGSTNPGVGVHDVSIGEPYAATALPAAGYHFVNWNITGAGTLSNTTLTTTWATLIGDAELTAYFAADATPKTLTLAVSPTGGGSTNPGVGAHTVYVGQTVQLTAIPASGYHFDSWTTSGGATLSQTSLVTTTALVSDNATVTAVFAANSTSAAVTIDVSPAASGNTVPGAGQYTLQTGQTVKLEAQAATGHHFVNWSCSGGVDIDSPELVTTWAVVSGNGGATANFAADTTATTLLMSVAPSGSGSTNPGVGTQTVNIGEPIAIEATAASGYHFQSWAVSGDAVIANPSTFATSVLLSGAAAVTANFERNATSGVLTMSVLPSAAGCVNPGPGAHTVNLGESLRIQARSATGYHFISWMATGKATISNRRSLATTVVLSGNATVAALFAPNTVKGILTMAIAPNGSGCTFPPPGSRSVNSLERFVIFALPKKGYHFTGWTVKGLGRIDNPNSFLTTAVLLLDATITAHFQANATPVTVTMAAAPAAAGETNPGAGTHQFSAGETINLAANPEPGFHFTGWTAAGGVRIADLNLAVTTAALTGDATITANFSANTTTVTLTMAPVPDNSGMTNPGAGSYQYSAGETVPISAEPLTGYYFVRWSVQGAATVSDPTLADTYALLTGDATITAQFAASAKMVTLTMAASPADGGTTNPGVGAQTVEAGSATAIEALPANGYHFINWQTSGLATVAAPHLISTTVLTTGDATVTALFAPNAQSATLTMAVSPTASGSVTPATGTHTVSVGETITLAAVPVVGYHFTGWTSQGNIEIMDPNLTSTAALISGSCSVTAAFAANTAQAILTMAASPAAAGLTNPGVGAHTATVGATYQIEAQPQSGYYFKSWTTSGKATVAAPTLVKTSVVVNGDATITALFAAVSQTANLTMAATPSASGTVNPGVGSHAVVIGATYAISATAATGYHFAFWQLADGSKATITDPTLVSTSVLIGGDATVTAVFAANGTTAQIQLASNPVGGGQTIPGNGTYTLNVGATYKATASAGSGYHFDHWSASGKATIDSPTTVQTYILVEGDATVTAQFYLNTKSVTLALAVTPTSSGTTNPGVGSYTVNAGEPQTISAHPADGYYFSSWDVTGDADIADAKLSTTVVTPRSDTTVTATFAKAASTALFTAGVTPTGTGTTSPAGELTLNVGQSYEILAVAVDGYHFVKWTPSGSIAIANADLSSTYISLTGNGGATAEFAENSAPAVITFAVTPDTSGSTNPGAGSHTFQVGQTIEILANPASGYHFVKWSAEGAAVIADTTLVETYAQVNGDAVITAKFAVNTVPVTLTMAAQGGGQTIPKAGSYQAMKGEVRNVQAVAAADYHFVNWSVSGAGSITSTNLVSTYVTINGDTTVTANFAPNTLQDTLTMAANPASTAKTSPEAGAHTVNLLQPYTISAAPTDGYYFSHWEIQGPGTLANPHLTQTVVTLSGTATVTAYVLPVATQATLTMAVSPADAGETTPPTGQTKVNAGETFSLTATASDGYYFSGWSSVGPVAIGNPKLRSTTAILSGDATITANFTQNGTPLVLTMSALPAGAGGTNPGAGTHSVNSGELFTIEAQAAPGYHFAQWSLSGAGLVADAKSPSTSAAIILSSEISAHFAPNTTTSLLTITTVPTGSGGTSPGSGSYTINTDEPFAITATPGPGYSFESWTATEGAAIADMAIPNTTVTLAADATVVAHFSKAGGNASLTLAVSPSDAGTTNPGIGTTPVRKGDVVKIEAATTGGYFFANWTGTSGAEIQDASNPSTYVKITGDALVTACFANATPPAILWMAVSPADAGLTSPAVGQHEVTPMQELEIEAAPAEGYKFVAWTSEGPVQIEDALSETTIATISASATITATFALTEETATLTLQVENEVGGLVSPWKPARVKKNTPVPIYELPFDGFVFVDWRLGAGDAQIGYSPESGTTVSLASDALLYAKFSPVVRPRKTLLDVKVTRNNFSGKAETPADSINLRNAVMSVSAFDPQVDTARVYAGGMDFALSTDTGEFTKTNSGYTYRSNDKTTTMGLLIKQGYWNFKAKKLQLNDQSYPNGIAAVLDTTAKYFGANYPTTRSTNWSYRNGKNLPATELVKTGMSAFTIKNANGSFRQTSNNSLVFNITQATLTLASGYSFDPQTDSVLLYVDNVFFPIVPGSFKQKAPGVYRYNDTNRKTNMTLDLAKGKWSIRFKQTKSDKTPSSNDGLDIYLVVGSAEGGLRIPISYKSTFKYR